MFDAYVSFQARLRPHAMAIVAPDRWATYAELEADVNRLAAGLNRLGIAPGRGVAAIRIRDDYLRHAVFLALARLGVASSPGFDPGADFGLSDQGAGEDPRNLALSRDWIEATLAAEPTPVAPVRGAPDDVVRILLSSGTTAAPRRIGLSWPMIESNVRSSVSTYLGGKAGRWVQMTGLESSLGQTLAIAAWATGATLVVGMTTEALAEQIDALSPSVVALTPHHLRLLLHRLPPAFPYQAHLRLALPGGGLSRTAAQEARLRLCPDLVICYGATECGLSVVGDAALLDAHPGLAGYAVPGLRVEVVDGEGAPLPAGQQGEVRISGERVARAYIGDPEASALAFRDGGFHPGDLGRLTPQGLLLIDGRLDDRMNLGGMKFLPQVLEDLVMTCPGIADCAAFAVPGAGGIDGCWLAVVAGEGFDRATLSELIAAQGHDLPPVRFAWTDAIPRNAMGKIERRKLREDTIAALGAAATG